LTASANVDVVGVGDVDAVGDGDAIEKS